MDTATALPPPTYLPSGRRHYSDRERSAAIALLEANSGNVNRTARELGIPEVTLRQWKQGHRNPVPLADVSDVKAELAQSFETLAFRLIRQAGKQIADMSGSQAVLAAAIATDKMLLCRGEATSIVSTADAERAALLESRYSSRPAILVTPTTPTLPEHTSTDDTPTS